MHNNNDDDDEEEEEQETPRPYAIDLEDIREAASRIGERSVFFNEEKNSFALFVLLRAF